MKKCSNLVLNKDWEIFDKACKFTDKGSRINLSNWIISELGGWLKDYPELKMTTLQLTPQNLGNLMRSIQKQEISGKQAKLVLTHLLDNGGEVATTIELLGLQQISDDDSLAVMIHKIIEENPSALEVETGKKESFWISYGADNEIIKGAS